MLDGKNRVLIKWEGFPSEVCTYENPSNLPPKVTEWYRTSLKNLKYENHLPRPTAKRTRESSVGYKSLEPKRHVSHLKYLIDLFFEVTGISRSDNNIKREDEHRCKRCCLLLKNSNPKSSEFKQHKKVCPWPRINRSGSKAD